MDDNTSTLCLRRDIPSCPIFGAPAEFVGDQLPNHCAVMKCYIYERMLMKRECKKDPPVSEIASTVALKLQNVYSKASIPSLSLLRIIAMIKNYHKKYRGMMKSNVSKKDTNAYKQKLSLFLSQANILFDVAACKCKDIVNCSCKLESKIPIAEKEFIMDQRTDRKMFIGKVDGARTGVLQKICLRRIIDLEQYKPQDHNTPMDISISGDESSSITSIESSSSSADEFVPPSAKKTKINDVKRCKTLTHMAVACDRTGISDRAAALIATSVLQDYGIVSPSTSKAVIDKNKIRRERSLARKNLRVEAVKNKNAIESIYFDGRKDQTLINEKQGNVYHKKTILEEHIAVIAEPNSKYIGHISLQRGTAQNIATGIIDFLEEKQIDTNVVRAIGCDGTVVNTGAKGGAIRQLEIKLGKPLQWFVCQLHANELPLRHLMQQMDGKTIGPRGYTGEIGKQLEKCETRPVTTFTPIDTEMPSIDCEILNDLSNDQKYLYNIAKAVSTGYVSDNLATLQPGKTSHSRWLTTANRILLLYVSIEEPSDSLVAITTFIVKLYAPMWFLIKKNSTVANGAKNVHKTLELCQNLSDDTVAIITPVIQRNAYFAHPENILLAMIQDERPHICELGWRRIMKARQNVEIGVRQFEIPELIFTSNDYSTMIDWQSSNVTEPPLTTSLSDEVIEDMIRNKVRYTCQKFPCHTQAVERSIKLITEASFSVVGSENRDGFIRTKLSSREKMPVFNTKSQYVI